MSRDSTFGMKRLVHGLKIVQNSARNVYIGEISIESILGELPDPRKYVFYKVNIVEKSLRIEKQKQDCGK